MVWLYLPPEAHTRFQAGSAGSSASRSVRAQEASTLGCTLPCQTTELFVTLSGKALPRPPSWRGWKTRPWIKRLSGTMLKPSMANRGVASWISCMAAIHASHSPLQGKSWEKKTRATSGRTSPKLFVQSNRPSASSKMSADIYDWGLNKSTMTYQKWVIALRQACLQRKKWVRRISASDCSSWPTARVSSANGASQKEILAGNPKGRLEVSAVMWPTATATDSLVQRARPPEKMIRKDGRNVLRTPSLAETVMQPKGFPYTKQDLAKSQSGKDYKTAKAQWPTPRAREPGSASKGHGKCLNEVSQNWATPTTRDWKDGAATSPKVKTGSVLGRQAPRSKVNGKASQLTLNPLFVEWLMGWPIGWTGLEPVETAWCHWQQHMHFALWQLKQLQKTEQNDLFSNR